MLLAELGVLSLGAIAVPIFPDYGGRTLVHCLRDSGARVVVCGTRRSSSGSRRSPASTAWWCSTGGPSR